MKYPKFYNISKNEIKSTLKKRVISYTPEWKLNFETPDPGAILTNIFLNQTIETIDLLNASVKNYYYSFLNFINPSALFAIPSKVKVVFESSVGVNKMVVIPKGTSLESSSSLGAASFFTSEELCIYPITISNVYFLNTKLNTIVKSKIENYYFSGSSLNLNENILFFKSTIFNDLINEASFKLILNDKQFSEQLVEYLLSNSVSFEFLTNTKWMEFSSVKFTGTYFELKKDKDYLIDKNESSNFRIKINKIDKVLSEFSIKNPLINLITYNFSNSISSFATNTVSKINDNENIKPFEENFQRFDEFLIVSNSVLSKNGSIINIDFDLEFNDFIINTDESKIDWKIVMKKSEFEKLKIPLITIFEVDWLYFNGTSWKELEIDKNYKKIFNANLNLTHINFDFICPIDLKANYEDDIEVYAIKIKIKKIENEFKTYGIYKSPIIKNIHLAFNYTKDVKFNNIFEYNRLEYLEHFANVYSNSKEITIFKNEFTENNSIYLEIDKTIEIGTLNLLIVFKKSNYSINSKKIKIVSKNFNVQNKNSNSIEFLDGTFNLSGTGIIKLFIKEKIIPTKLFNIEASWIEITTDNLDFDNIKGIYFNSVEANQLSYENNIILDTLLEQSEYFIDYENIVDIEVLVENKKWKRTNTFLDKNSDDCVYCFDPISKQLTFGNGFLGKKAPYGEYGLIKLNISITNGTGGIIKPFEITSPTFPIAYINKVFNPISSYGGTDIEDESELITRTAQDIKSKNRVLSIRDYEHFLITSFDELKDVKCLINRDRNLKKVLGNFTFALISKSPYKYKISDTLKNEILSSLYNVLPATINKENIDLIDTDILEIKYSLIVYCDNENISTDSIKNAINEYLNIDIGNFNKGWKINELPKIDGLLLFLNEKFINVYINIFKEEFVLIKNNYTIELNRKKLESNYMFIIKHGKHNIMKSNEKVKNNSSFNSI
ncbi:hypothetical protein [Helicovermis profundi]|uniref:Baseplate protein J-like domain-containing protein n=1 Tax=Helicovermis profundi TaxID=3065157 RepID=A0AAU9E391_9FIRM|nr:hypothetical protein HLPR_13650 [Clostridia bacterium S502]